MIKRLRNWIIVLLPIIGLCLLASTLLARCVPTSPCASEIALRDMEVILQAARSSPSPTALPPEDIQRRYLISMTTWRRLESWMSRPPTDYKVIILDLNWLYSYGDYPVVGVQLSNGINFQCKFYNSMLEECVQFERLKTVEDAALEKMNDLLMEVRNTSSTESSQTTYLTGEKYKSLLLSLRDWVKDSQGEDQLRIVSKDVCFVVKYAVEAKLSTGITFVCNFEHHRVVSCSEVKEKK